MNFVLRPASADDLPRVIDIYYSMNIEDSDRPPPKPDHIPILQYFLDRGRLALALVDDVAVGFISGVMQGEVECGATLYVLPEYQGSGIGKRCLTEMALPPGTPSISAIANTPTMYGLAAARGLDPYYLLMDVLVPRSAQIAPLPHVEVLPDRRTLQEIAADDAKLTKRYRVDDYAYWINNLGSQSVVVMRGGEMLGSAIVSPVNDTSLWRPRSTKVGPINLRKPEFAADVALSVVRFALRNSAEVCLYLPVGNSSFRPIVQSGGRVMETHVFFSSDRDVVPDPAVYVPSGYALL